jgi:hypothetical protein
VIPRISLGQALADPALLAEAARERPGGGDKKSAEAITGRLSSDSYSSPFVLNRRINVASVMFRFLFLIESLRFCAGLFV